MSSSYQGRHYGGRHRVQNRRARLPRAFSSSFVLPTAAAAALVVTATGATVVHPTPPTLELDGPQTAMARTEQVADDAMVTDLAARRQAASIQTAALQGRNEQAARAARSAQRKARAKAKMERESKRWVRPIRTWHITSGFGWRWGKSHDGIDLGASTGTPLYAMSKGEVIGSFYDSSFGNKVEIRYWDGSISWYGHLSNRIAQKGDTVLPGELVGLVGNTGHSFGSHLHFEMQRSVTSDSPIDPVTWLKRHGLY
ncbi:MAG TPA: M23 family metallopeptidase [Nocardioides sp.]|nr:M23 family metallopeptidase [Nocardioides sp.]